MFWLSIRINKFSNVFSKIIANPTFKNIFIQVNRELALVMVASRTWEKKFRTFVWIVPKRLIKNFLCSGFVHASKVTCYSPLGKFLLPDIAQPCPCDDQGVGPIIFLWLGIAPWGSLDFKERISIKQMFHNHLFCFLPPGDFDAYKFSSLRGPKIMGLYLKTLIGHPRNNSVKSL